MCLLAGAVSVMAASGPLTTTPVIMFDNKDWSGNSQNFPVAMPLGPLGGCSPCTSLVRLSFAHATARCNRAAQYLQTRWIT